MGPGMMWGGAWMGFGALFMVVFFGLIVWAITALVQSPPQADGTRASVGEQESALEILKRRYALGEINEEEYEAKKQTLA